ncbi:MAG: SAM-dependent methyltransferase [Clostridiaceae bacterium]|jgi:tRNA (adenine22-N1)-methyltransferase|nr:SAM-dependent methyltransferase [Clostridiaceae bacterium]
MVLRNKRLLMVANMIPKCECMADIGTDHALLPIYLVLNGKCNRAIASDVKIGPLQSAEKNIKRQNLSDKIETRLGSGFEVLKTGECQVAVLAGMGGILISRLIEDSFDIAKKTPYLVLQPNTEEASLRKYLFDNGFEILDENAVMDKGHCYLAVLCRHVPGLVSDYDEIDLVVGKVLYKKDTEGRIVYYRDLRQKADKVLNKLEKVKNRTEEIEKRIVEYKKVLRWIDENVEGI